MNAKGFVVAAALLAIGSAQAQLVDQAPSRLSAEPGGLGAKSTVKGDGFVTRNMAEAHAGARPAAPFAGETSTGAYGALGAQYELNDRATLKGEGRTNGSANKFGSGSNASGVRGSVGFGF